ncbi:poly(3-hydroxybutyrate) depolymerase-like [Saccoglossus kowalevskii]|uniref:Uncharacterized protein LOC100371241 n=1 Tax=Saccoglossus kowalevskii TaxID=10224 RepID=A0ABM0GIP0_SACKO|nr:PREDICTED: uncharacterized protein LOC100371241 [Saccoglossus kowalevskii]
MKLPVIVCAVLVNTVHGECQWWWCEGSEDPALLGSYQADSNEVSVSGVSSGGYMAIQMHVAYSASIMGSGILAAGPYHCAQGSVLTGLDACMSNPEEIVLQDLIDFTDTSATKEDIDATTNFASGKTWLFSGLLDTAVHRGVVVALEDYCKHYMPLANVMTEYGIPAGHAMITEHYGSVCSTEQPPYINDCDYPSPYVLMNHIYEGTLSKPASYGGAMPGDMTTFNQTELVPEFVGSTSLDSVGYIYVPTGCVSTPGCKLHIVFHGCLQGRNVLGEEYALNTGYNEVGEENDIIIVYPQVTSSLGNPMGCWDWWGYTDSNYDLKSGVQLEFIKNIIDRVTS